MVDQHSSIPLVLAILVLYIVQIGLINAEGNSTETETDPNECQAVGDLALLDEWTDKGVVFICYNSSGILKWGVVCSIENWDDAGAQVVCRQLGYGGSSQAVQNAQYEFFSLSSILKYGVMGNVRCLGNETRLLDCKHDLCNNVYATQLAGVRCDVAGKDDSNIFLDDDQFDFNNDYEWDHGGGSTNSRPDKTSTVVIVAVIATIALAISGIIRCVKRSQLQARQHNQIPNATVQNFQTVPPNHPSNYEVGQHPPPSSAHPNSQQMDSPPKDQPGQMMPQGYANPYPAGAHQYPPPGGMMPPTQPNPYPPGGPQCLPPAGMMPPSQPYPYPPGEPTQYPPPGQPNPYQAGAQQYPSPPKEVPPNPYPSGVQPYPPPPGTASPSTPYIPSNEGTNSPNCPPPSYDESVRSDSRQE